MHRNQEPGRRDRVLQAFLYHFGLDPGAPSLSLLPAVLREFARLPYENLTKILAEEGESSRWRRRPAQVVGDHINLGTGGTCFSLTAALRHLVRSLGFPAEPIMADRPYGPDTHCALHQMRSMPRGVGSTVGRGVGTGPVGWMTGNRSNWPPQVK